MRAISERLVRVELGREPYWGRVDGDEIAVEDGRRILAADACYLAPAETSKIIAVHLSYRSRLEEYRARLPGAPSDFLKPPTTPTGHRGKILRRAGARYLNYEGELAVVVGERMKGVPEAEALACVGGYACANDVGLHDFRHADRGSMLRVKG